MTPVTFLAVFEDIAKINAILSADGADPNEGDNVHEIAQSGRADTKQRFDNLKAAEAWAKERIVAGATTYGAADIVEIEDVPHRKRCKYCTCHGRRRIRRHLVDDTGIVESEDEDDCHNG